jgi:hypothetical protein
MCLSLAQPLKSMAMVARRRIDWDGFILEVRWMENADGGLECF